MLNDPPCRLQYIMGWSPKLQRHRHASNCTYMRLVIHCLRNTSCQQEHPFPYSKTLSNLWFAHWQDSVKNKPYFLSKNAEEKKKGTKYILATFPHLLQHEWKLILKPKNPTTKRLISQEIFWEKVFSKMQVMYLSCYIIIIFTYRLIMLDWYQDTK